MNVGSERSVSLWMETATVEDAAPLSGDERADVVVVGAGISGLSTAYELARAGRSVVVLDRGPLGRGMTARTSAHLASELDDFYHELIRLRGLDEARRYYASQAAALDRIETIQRDEGIDCDFRRLDGYLFVAPGTDPAVLDREIEAAREVGFEGVEWADRAPIPGADTGRCLRFRRQARFHPLKYLNGLIRCIRRDGGRLYADTAVRTVEESGGEVVVRTERGHTVRARAGVVATNSPINDRLAIHTKQAPYRTYVIAARVPRGAVTDALYWDTLEHYHYVRLQPAEDGSHDLLIVGGEDHKTGEADDAEERLERLEAWTRQHFPQMQDVAYRWSGQVMEPVDFLPFAGRNHGNDQVYVATGDSGEGLSNGVAASLLIRDLVLGRDNHWAAVLDPRRVTVGATGEFVRENVTMAVNLTEYVTGGEVGSVEELKPGQGAVIRQGLAKVAAYRDEDGRLHLRSAICTHMGCVVHWNPFERCWDCPCHGSHFAIDGTAINGPAAAPLAEVSEPEGGQS
ncbi:MAG: FAD-dependent oxidoreductase [Pseudomonadota bacterium]|nr:FAD-dependent oxidoreductase [Pseudomonadota bacterium]